MKQTLLTTISLLLAALSLSSCKKSVNDTFKPEITGRAGEVLVVMDDRQKNDTTGAYLRFMLGDTYAGLNTDEPIFEMHTIAPPFFDFEMHKLRNLVLVTVSDTIRTDTVLFTRDAWAKPQAVMQLQAASAQKAADVLRRNHVRVITFFVKAERDRLINYYSKHVNASLMAEVNSKWDVSICIPNEYDKCKPLHADSISWFMCDTRDFQDGLVIYSFPYTGPECVSRESLLNRRDTMLRANIGGPNNSVMTTERRANLDEEIVFQQGTYGGHFVSEIRGLWRMDNYPMGGPFLMRAVVDEAKARVIVTDGYVYYPSREQKRNHIRSLEAIMHTLKLTE